MIVASLFLVFLLARLFFGYFGLTEVEPFERTTQIASAMIFTLLSESTEGHFFFREIGLGKNFFVVIWSF